MDLIYRFEGELDEPSVIGPVTDGTRIDFSFSGDLVDGEIAGGKGRGLDYARQRDDGIVVFDARNIFEIPGGHLHLKAQGYTSPPPGYVPGDPQSGPPDVRMIICGYGFCETGVPEYAHLNRTLERVDGWVNMATRELVLEGRTVEPAVAAARQDRSLAFTS